MENHENIKALYRKYLDDRITPEERDSLFEFFKHAPAAELTQLITESMDESETPQNLDYLDQRTLAIFRDIQDTINGSRRTKVHPGSRPMRLWRIAAAIAALFLVAVSIFLIQRNTKTQKDAEYTAVAPINVQPGGDKAILTLSDGRKIDLTKAQVGVLTGQSGLKITKTAMGEITYELTGTTAGAKLSNTIQTPRGGQFRVILPDGSKVWLNAASSITYPLAFNTGQRRVTLKGEAYFEVAHDKRKPFIVTCNEQQITVLGTHFNINGYADEHRTVTTLAEGSVRVNVGAGSVLLNPGEQAVYQGDLKKQVADMETELAWKNGKIYFKYASLEAVLRQAARWYDIEIEYQGPVTNEIFTGGISRSSSLADLLKILELSGVRFQLVQAGAQKKLIVKS